MNPITQSHKSEKAIDGLGTSKTSKEIVAFLDALKPIEYGKQTVQRMKQLDALFGNPSNKLDIILVGGTNGKSSAIHFASKLLKEENYKVGAVYSSHIISYTERINIDFQAIQNKSFTEILSDVISTVQNHKINATSFELMLIASLLHFKKELVDVALIEVGIGGKYDATAIFNSKITAITRIALDHDDILGQDLDTITLDMLELAKPNSFLICAEQSKLRLQKMKTWAEERNITWAMPIRKLASLPYIYEQLYGRTASLGERIAQIYVEDIRKKFSPFLRGNLLATQEGQRGRPTLEAKRNAELNPIKTLKKFWVDSFSLLNGRFEFLNKEKPSVLLDTADNIDAFENLFLGIRLLHYQHPLKDLSLIIGLSSNINASDAVKMIRYLLKKVSGQVIFVALPENQSCHNPQDLAHMAKEMGMKAKSCPTFTDAFALVKDSTDERNGLTVITGSLSLISEYWKYRGIKKA